MKSITRSYLGLILWVVILLAISSAFGALSRTNMADWYDLLDRSKLTPPGYVFALVWPCLYIMIAASGWLIWRLGLSLRLKRLYLLQLILNWLWTPIFFHYHLTGTALICLCAILVVLFPLIFRLYKQSLFAAFLLLPYALWLLFAGYLNYCIWMHN